MSEYLQKIILPQVQFEGADEGEKFVRFYLDLYRVPILKDGLDLILTKLLEKDLSFEVRIVKGWDTSDGCYLTEQRKFFNHILGKFSRKIHNKIIIKSFLHNVILHEMAHAMDFESGIDLNEDFRKCIGLDMKDRTAPLITLQAQIQRLMIDALKSYPKEQFIAELFARFFELLAISREVRGTGDFKLEDVLDHFANVNNFLSKIFNPQIRAKINPEIAAMTSQLVTQLGGQEPQKKFADDVKSFYKTSEKKWGSNVKSNAMWQKGWKKYEEIEDKKNN